MRHLPKQKKAFSVLYDMKNQKKHIPTDSEQKDPGYDKAVVKKKDTSRSSSIDKTSDPAKKRERSEQPPTRHNAKT